MENVEIKTKTKVKQKETLAEDMVPLRAPKPKDTKKLSVVEAERSEPDAFLKAQIKKMSKEQKEVALKFMAQRNRQRVEAFMEPAYTQADMDLYK